MEQMSDRTPALLLRLSDVHDAFSATLDDLKEYRYTRRDSHRYDAYTIPAVVIASA
jgi:hypothetical protein